MKYDLDGKTFRSVANSDNGEVGADTLFHYHQDGELVSADYRGGSIVAGHLIGKMPEDDRLDIRYHHINVSGELMLGKCLSTPEVLPDGRLRFQESWQWLSGDGSAGHSEIEEVER